MTRMQFGVGVVLIMLMGLAGCQTVPSGLEVQGPEILRVTATGDQIYVWREAQKMWMFKAPEARFSGAGVTGRHYAGPTWEADDGSLVLAHKVNEKPSPDANSIPWLLLKAVDHLGRGILSQVTFIQRLNTKGGVAPTAPGTKDGQEARVHYTAVYIFYGPGAAGGK